MKNLLLIGLLALVISCGNQNSVDVPIFDNPAAEGFNEAGSDPEAIALADSVMFAMGGRKAWDNTRYVCWSFFGSRELYWDKFTGNVRIEAKRDSSICLVNINTMEGRFFKAGREILDADSVQNFLNRGRRHWINDSYWLVMPFKLKDTGVTLKYLGSDTTNAGINSQVLELTFENVGVTPQNRYNIWIGDSSKLVRQWAYYRTDTLDTPGFVQPWDEYEKRGNIWLSGNRGGRSLTKILVSDSIPEKVFTTFEPVRLNP